MAPQVIAGIRALVVSRASADTREFRDTPELPGSPVLLELLVSQVLAVILAPPGSVAPQVTPELLEHLGSQVSLVLLGSLESAGSPEFRGTREFRDTPDSLGHQDSLVILAPQGLAGTLVLLELLVSQELLDTPESAGSREFLDSLEHQAILELPAPQDSPALPARAVILVILD